MCACITAYAARWSEGSQRRLDAVMCPGVPLQAYPNVAEQAQKSPRSAGAGGRGQVVTLRRGPVHSSMTSSATSESCM
jgi:hypothetical protein